MTPYKNAWHHIRRSPFQSLVAISVMAISFFCLNTFAVVSSGMTSILNYFETKPEITIFLKDGLDKSMVESLQSELANYPNIREIKFISKEKALALYKEQNKNSPMLTEMVTSSILPASFEVSVSNVKVLEQISQNFTAKTSQVEEIIYQKDIIESLLSWTNFIRKTGIIIVSVTSILTFLIISIIISMKITNRKDEISISRLLGASKFYVKKPFIIEGLFYGLIGGFIGFTVNFVLVLIYSNQINVFFNPIIFITQNYQYYLALFAISEVSASFIGYISSWYGVRRYIKY